jgi:hypothetical protein
VSTSGEKFKEPHPGIGKNDVFESNSSSFYLGLLIFDLILHHILHKSQLAPLYLLL